MTTITNTLIDGIGAPVPNVYTEVRLLAPTESDNAFEADTESQIVSRVITRTDSDGIWSLDLIPTGNIVPSNSVYQVTHKIPGQADQTSYFQVPGEGATPTPVPLEDCLTVAPAELPRDFILTSPNSTRYLIIVDNAGTLSTELVA